MFIKIPGGSSILKLQCRYNEIWKHQYRLKGFRKIMKWDKVS